MSEPSLVMSWPRATSLRVKEPTKSFQAIIEETEANSSAIRGYFNLKRDRGSRAVPKPILNGSVIRILSKKIENCVNMRTNVACLVLCLEEFSLNNEVVEPWCEFYQEISNLFHICLQYLCQSLTESSKVLSILCCTLISIAEKSDLLSSELFNKCAEKLLTLVFKKHISKDLQSLILSAVSDICKKSSPSKVSGTTMRLSCHLNYLAKMILDFNPETQICVYILLYKSVHNIEEAKERVPIWFWKWPSLQEIFIEGYSRNLNQGCGLFLNKLFELRSSPAMDEWRRRSNLMTPRSSCSNKPSQSLPKDAKIDRPSECISGNIDVNATSKVYTESSGTENEAALQDTPAKINFENLKAKTGTPCQSSKEAHWRKYQTPYYPDGRKSLSLRKNAEADAQRSIRKSAMTTQDNCSVPEQRADKFLGIEECKALSNKGTLKERRNYDRRNDDKQVPIQNYDGHLVLPRDRPIKNKISEKDRVLNLDIEGDRSKVEKWLKNSTHAVTSVNSKFSSSADVLNSEKRHSSLQNLETNTEKHQFIEPQINAVSTTSIKAGRWNYQQMECSGKLNKPALSPYFKSRSPDYDNVPKENSDQEPEIEIIQEIDSKPKRQKRTFHASSASVSKKIKQDSPEDTNTLNNSVEPRFHLRNSKPKRMISTRPEDKWTNLKSSQCKSANSRPAQECCSEYEKISCKKKSGKRFLFSASNENWNPASPPLNPKVETDGGVRSPLGNSNLGNRPVNLWEQKLKELENKRREEKEAVKNDLNDVYNFDPSETNRAGCQKKASRAPAKKSAVALKSQSVKKINTMSDRKNTSKAGISQKTFSSVKPAMKKSRFDSDIDSPCFEGISRSRDQDEEGQKTTALKSTVTSKMKQDQALFNASPTVGKTSVLKNTGVKLSARMPQTTSSYYYSPALDDSGDDPRVEVKPPSVSTHQNIAVLNSYPGVVNEDTSTGSGSKSNDAPKKSSLRFKFPVPNELPSKINSEEKTHSVITASKVPKSGDSMKALGDKSRDIDSGIDITSASEYLSPSSKENSFKVPPTSLNTKQVEKKPYSSRIHLLKTQVRDYLESAKKSNEDMASNQTEMSSEILELQSLAEKLALSVNRCKDITTNNQQKISEQATALTGCSKYLGPYEDQTFRAQIPTTYPTDYKEFARQVRAQSRQKVMEAVKSFLEKDHSFSDSSTDDEKLREEFGLN